MGRVGAAILTGLMFGNCWQPAYAQECQPCIGWTVDMAVDSPTVGFCLPDYPLPGEFEIEHEGLPSEFRSGCSVEVPLLYDRRVHVRARAIGGVDWSGWSAWAHRLNRCRGDFDRNGVVNGGDFVVFRSYLGVCEE